MKIEDAISAQLKTMAEYSIPLYTAKGEREPYSYHLLGTGIFLEVEDRTFLITAAHVLDETEFETIHVFDPEGKPMYLEGDKFCTPRKEGDTEPIRKDDPVDVGVIEVPWSREQISCYKICTPSMIYAHKPKENTLYIFSGYPSSKNRPKRNSNMRKVRPYFSMGDIVSDEKYDKHEKKGYSKVYNIIINFDSKKLKNLKGERINAPDQYGMSGGPVWIFEPSSVGTDKQPIRLAGVGIEWHKGEKVLIGTSIIAAMEILRKGPLKEG